MPSRSGAAPITPTHVNDPTTTTATTRTTTSATTTSDLEAVPARAAQLLYGVVSRPCVRATLSLAGLTTEEIAEGRKLFDACLAEPASTTVFDKTAIEKRRAALSELNAWDEPGFARFGAALKQHAPDAHAYVFGGVVASDVAQHAAMGIATFLGRVAVIEAGTLRPADPAAIAILEARGLTREVRQHLIALVGVALGPGADESLEAPLDPARLDRLRTLAAWYDEWAETARALLKKREDLARLGLSQKKPRARKARRPAVDAIPDTERAPVKPLRLYASGPGPR